MSVRKVEWDPSKQGLSLTHITTQAKAQVYYYVFPFPSSKHLKARAD